MELLKSLSKSALLVLAGAVVLTLALSNGISIGSFSFTPSNSWVAQLVLGLLGSGLIVAGLTFQIHGVIRDRRQVMRGTPGSVDEVFRTLDEMPGFADVAPESQRISILARTAVNLLTSYQRLFVELCSQGCEIRLIIVNPRSDAAKYLYGSQIDVYKDNLATTLHQLGTLAAKIGPRLELRMTRDVPPFSLVHFQKRGVSLFHVQLNFMHSRIGRDRPVFIVKESDKWYKSFTEEYESLWHHAELFQPGDPVPQRTRSTR